jgi:hypothetical protein
MAGGGQSAVTRVRRSSSGLVLALLALLGVPVAADPLRFAWPTPAQALVAVEAAKGGYSARSSVRLTVTRDVGGHTRLDFSDARLLAINGRDLSGGIGTGPGEMGSVALEALMPSLLVGADGRVQDVLGIERLGDAIVAGGLGGADSARTDAAAARLRQVLARPGVQAQLRARAGEDWRAWVGVWVGRDLRPGAALDIVGVVPGMGPAVQAKGVMTYTGVAAGFPPSAVRLRLELTADGPEFRRAVFDGLAKVAGQDRQSLGDLSPEHVETASRRQTLELVTDPATLRPYRVDMGTHIAFKLRGQPVQTQTEAKSFLFEWR